MTERSTYIYGNTVRKEDYVPEVTEAPSYYARGRVKEHVSVRPSVSRRNIGYLFFLTLALAAAGVILVKYVTLRSELIGNAQAISTLEKQLSALKQENDDSLARIEADIDLNEIKRIAISEYGMQYASDGQILTVSEEGGRDYVRQIADIP